MIQNHDLKKAVDDIMDVFTGADGGVAFVQFCAFINRMDELAKKNDRPAQELLKQVRGFHRLIKVVTT